MMPSLLSIRLNETERRIYMESIVFGLGMVSGVIVCIGIEAITTN